MYALWGFVITIFITILSCLNFHHVENSLTYTGSNESFNYEYDPSIPVFGCSEDFLSKKGGDSIQDATYKRYRKLKPKHKLTFDEFCYPSSYKIQPQQEFAGEYMAPGSSKKEILIFHKIGAGKTCLSIQIGRKWIRHGKPLFVMPASLIPGFRNELRSGCADDDFLTYDERAELADVKPGGIEYRSIIERSDARINKTFQIYSYNKFATDGKQLRAPIIIIDEVQNINNTSGVFYQSLIEWIEHHKHASVVCMSGTPLFDHPGEINGLARLLRVEGKANEIIPADIPKLFKGKVSYYAGAPAYTFPTTYIKVKKCEMSQFQKKWYQSEVEAEMKSAGIRLRSITNDFYIKSRQRSNIVYPLGLTSAAGMDALTPALIRSSLATYSTKFAALIKKLNSGKLSFVYTGFTGSGGIAALTKCLRALGWSDFFESGPGRRRFVVWSGDESAREKDLIRATFNSPTNDNASKIQIVIGSPSIKEGVSLMRVRQVHVLESYWNHSRLEQVFGRAVRYCSHKVLPKEDRDVTIYIYASVASEHIKKNPTPLDSIDLYMLQIADEKRDMIAPYVNALIDVAVDKHLW